MRSCSWSGRRRNPHHFPGFRIKAPAIIDRGVHPDGDAATPDSHRLAAETAAGCREPRKHHQMGELRAGQQLPQAPLQARKSALRKPLFADQGTSRRSRRRCPCRRPRLVRHRRWRQRGQRPARSPCHGRHRHERQLRRHRPNVVAQRWRTRCVSVPSSLTADVPTVRSVAVSELSSAASHVDDHEVPQRDIVVSCSSITGSRLPVACADHRMVSFPGVVPWLATGGRHAPMTAWSSAAVSCVAGAGWRAFVCPTASDGRHGHPFR